MLTVSVADMLSAADVARQFLSVVWDGKAPDIPTLALAIDRLLVRSHDIQAGDGTLGDGDAPPIDNTILYRSVAERFDYLGLYPIADPVGSIEDAIMMGDGVDDLADIMRDLREVIWWDENYGPDDAAFQFRLLFPHWGRHARELSLFLHAKWWG